MQEDRFVDVPAGKCVAANQEVREQGCHDLIEGFLWAGEEELIEDFVVELRRDMEELLYGGNGDIGSVDEVGVKVGICASHV
jgi:hypothetical protein